MSSSTDELSQYAPRWAREGIAKQKQNVSLPPAPQLVMASEDLPALTRTPFNGDVRAWRHSAVAPIEQEDFDLIVTDTPAYERRGFDERLFKTAAVASFAVIAMELIAFALFPNTVRDLFETRGPALSGPPATQTATVLQQSYAPVAPSSQLDTQDSSPVEAATTESTAKIADNAPVSGPVLTRIPVPVLKPAAPGQQASVASTATPASQAATQIANRAPQADSMYVVARAEPTVPPAQPQPQSQQAQSQPQQQPDLSQAQPHTVKLERYSLTQQSSQVQTQGAQAQPVQAAAAQTPAVQAPTPAVQTPVAQTPAIQTAAVQTPAVQPSTTQTPTVQALAPQKVQAGRTFSADEIDRMVARAEAFLAQGDVSAARVVLVRAAEARDPRAALALGSTYDPTVLQRMGAVGIKPDAEKAHFWYERAAEFGSGEAGKRLTALAQLAR